jgi:hypothetical protein
MGNTPTAKLDMSTFQPIADAAIPKSSSGAPATAAPTKMPSGKLDMSTFTPANPTQEQALSRTLQNMAYAMSGQSDKMHPDDKAEFDKGVEAGAKSAAVTTATGAASAALAPFTAPAVTGTEAVGTGILNPAGKEIMRDVTTYGPSVARQIFSHPLTQSLLARAAGYAGAGYILKALGVFEK